MNGTCKRIERETRKRRIKRATPNKIRVNTVCSKRDWHKKVFFVSIFNFVLFSLLHSQFPLPCCCLLLSFRPLLHAYSNASNIKVWCYFYHVTRYSVCDILICILNFINSSRTLICSHAVGVCVFTVRWLLVVIKNKWREKMNEKDNKCRLNSWTCQITNTRMEKDECCRKMSNACK